MVPDSSARLETQAVAMGKVNVAMIPEVIAQIVKELEMLDAWLTMKTEPILNGTLGPEDEWMTVSDLLRYIPGNPKRPTVMNWLYTYGIPHYKSGKTLLFRRSEIDAWLVRAVKYEYGDYFTKKRAFKDNPF